MAMLSADLCRPSELASMEVLGDVYCSLLSVLFADLENAGVAGRLERRWEAALSPATWPEVLRRYVLLRRQVRAVGRMVETCSG